MLEQARGVAMMLEHARMDNVTNFLLCIQQYGIDLLSKKSRNMSGSTALHAAGASNAMNILEYLLTEVCVNVNASDNWSRTALDEAMRSGHEDAVRYLRAAGGRHGANIDGARYPNTWPSSIQGTGPDAATVSSSNSSMSAVMPHQPQSSSIRPCDGVPGFSTAEAASTWSSSVAELNRPQMAESNRPHGEERIGSALIRHEVQVPASALNMRSLPDTKMASSGERMEFPGGASCGPGAYSLPDGTAEWELLPSDVVVIDVIGEGAFGEIRSGKWRGCPVAIKTLKSHCVADEIAIKEFNCEMSIWCRLAHPNIVQFLGVGYMTGQAPIMVCELMAGGSLQQKLQELQGSGKKLDFEQAFSIGSNVAGAMHYMHSRRPFAAIHRDLKPANILLTASGTAKVADFGLSKMFELSTSTPGNPFDANGTLHATSASVVHSAGGAWSSSPSQKEHHKHDENVVPHPLNSHSV
mmetsp:Transcript_19148/g.30969  ORF Transcript_19148/g.30969 Transcript_19148/m.30969 type:complete len:468 (-) Transcript_19148:43-1446(-)